MQRDVREFCLGFWVSGGAALFFLLKVRSRLIYWFDMWAALRASIIVPIMPCWQIQYIPHTTALVPNQEVQNLACES
jgi:hypothetical protein